MKIIYCIFNKKFKDYNKDFNNHKTLIKAKIKNSILLKIKIKKFKSNFLYKRMILIHMN